MINKIIQGDCIEVMKTLEDNCVDSIVTDPPYELGFMGKSWDATGIAYNVDMWKECFRVLKFGGHLLSFGGSRTYHRMAVAIEDAGFEIRDMVEWIYGSGFPKSLNIGKVVDKLQGNEREVMPNPKVKQQTASKEGTIHGSRPANTHITKGTSAWEGWGTALKPAHEPIVLARKPLSEKTVAENVLKWGTGGINIDGSRVGTDTERGDRYNNKPSTYGGNDNGTLNVSANGRPEVWEVKTGRFPANLIHDGSDEVVGVFPQTNTHGGGKGSGNKADWNLKSQVIGNYKNESGSASRFFYCAKASKSERNAGGVKNIHPTVKSINLMKYLIKLITPKGGVVLDPFTGSGSTLCAAVILGFNYIGIDLEEEYIKIARARVKYWAEKPQQEKLL